MAVLSLLFNKYLVPKGTFVQNSSFHSNFSSRQGFNRFNQHNYCEE